MTDSNVTSTPPTCQDSFPDPIPGIIPFASLTVIAGASGAGKTILLADWLQRMRSGQSVCGHMTNPATAYYVLAADRNWDTYARAFGAAGFPDVNRYVLADDDGFDPRNWGKKHSALALFEKCLEVMEPLPGSWVNIDPVAPLFIQGNQNDARDVALSLHWFRKMAKKYRITLALFANVGKQKSEETYRRAQDRIAGSGAFVAYSDTQISVDQDEEGVMTMRWTPRAAMAEDFQFKFDTKSGLFQPYQDTAKPRTSRDELPLSLVETLGFIPTYDQTITSPELVKLICESGQVKRAMAFRRIQHLLERGLIERSPLGVIKRSPPAVEAPVPVVAESPVDR